MKPPPPAPPAKGVRAGKSGLSLFQQCLQFSEAMASDPMIKRESALRALDRSQRREGPHGRRAGCPGVELSGTRRSERACDSLHVSFVKEARLNSRPKRASCTHSTLAAHAPLGGRTLALALARARDGTIRGRAAGLLLACCQEGDGTSPDSSIPGPRKRERERATAERRMRCKRGVRAGRPFGASVQPRFLRERDV
ncbi:hypothetical protein T492DRAFT_1116165 [Pavlovales sp. CCMP2436]|nr:hypothetical protein T492DRAFT_1116165 [Pavlovales sp. CCMP2436]